MRTAGNRDLKSQVNILGILEIFIIFCGQTRIEVMYQYEVDHDRVDIAEHIEEHHHKGAILVVVQKGANEQRKYYHGNAFH